MTPQGLAPPEGRLVERRSTVTIVWACRLRVEAYVAAGRQVEVPRPVCPACKRPMIFWSGYWHFRRVSRYWVRRGKCTSCGVSHALLPSFALVRRLDEAKVVGQALAGVVAGRGM